MFSFKILPHFLLPFITALNLKYSPQLIITVTDCFFNLPKFLSIKNFHYNKVQCNFAGKLTLDSYPIKFNQEYS